MKQFQNLRWMVFSWFGEPFEQVKDQIRDFALRDKKMHFFERFLARQTGKYRIVLSDNLVRGAARKMELQPLHETLLNGRASVLVFSSGCCMPDPMEKDLEILKELLPEDVDLLHIESTLDFDTTRLFSVLDNPTILIFDRQGYPAARLPYYHSAKEIELKYIESCSL